MFKDPAITAITFAGIIFIFGAIGATLVNIFGPQVDCSENAVEMGEWTTNCKKADFSFCMQDAEKIFCKHVYR